MVWLNDVRPRDLDGVIARGAGAGVGLYPISPYYARPPGRAGLLFGYASLTEAEIRTGIRLLSEVVQAPQTRRAPSGSHHSSSERTHLAPAPR